MKMKMQSDFNSMFEEFQRQVDVPDQLLNALKRMAEGRNYYWGLHMKLMKAFPEDFLEVKSL